ncbi:MAG TPA: pseudaminic acid synthase, partial [Verrucomicrobiales bacterium]|nr:pseudaminic acid synthase [Verrucomicrobiales bacterium]
LFAVKDIAAGEKLTLENIRSIRPGHGLAPKHLNEILGKKATQPIAFGTPLDWQLFE